MTDINPWHYGIEIKWLSALAITWNGCAKLFSLTRKAARLANEPQSRCQDPLTLDTKLKILAYTTKQGRKGKTVTGRKTFTSISWRKILLIAAPEAACSSIYNKARQAC
jgi:hypothetical protein